MFRETKYPEMIKTAPKPPANLLRFPLFAPYEPGARQAGDTDWVHGEVYEDAELRVTRFGPGLDIYDEDTLLGLLRAVPLKGELTAVKGADVQRPIQGGPTVADLWVGETSALTVNRYLGRSTDDEHLEQCHASIERIANTQLVIYRSDLRLEWKTILLNWSTTVDSILGKIGLQFSPLAVTLLQGYTSIEMNVRMQLSRVGKALHRYLTSLLLPGQAYRLPLDEVCVAIGYKGPADDAGRVLEQEVKILRAARWLKHGEVHLAGKRAALVLDVAR